MVARQPALNDAADQGQNLERLVGPSYDTQVLVVWLGQSEADIAKRADARELLRLRTGEGTAVYPTWQSTADGGLIPRLADVLNALALGSDDPWTWALWMSAPDSEHDSLTAWQRLAAGNAPGPLTTQANSDAAR